MGTTEGRSRPARGRRRWIPVTVLACVGLSIGLAGTAQAQTITDPTGSVSVGVPVAGESHADGSVLAYSWRGCARSGLVAASVDPLTPLYGVLSWEQTQMLYQALGHQATGCPGGSSYAAEGPVAVADGGARGAIAVTQYGDANGAVAFSLSGYAYGACWNPLDIGCVPSVALSGDYYGSAHGGTVSIGHENCSASDWGPVPGIAVCHGGHAHEQDSSSGSIAVQNGGSAWGRLLAVSVGSQSSWMWWFDTNSYDAHSSEGVAVSEDGNAHGRLAASSVNDAAYAGAGGVAVTTGNCGGYDADVDRWVPASNAQTGPGGVAVAGCDAGGGDVGVAKRDASGSKVAVADRNANSGAVAVARDGNATANDSSDGGLASVSAGGNAEGGLVSIGFE